MSTNENYMCKFCGKDMSNKISIINYFKRLDIASK